MDIPANRLKFRCPFQSRIVVRGPLDSMETSDLNRRRKTMPEALIRPELLRWARERARMEPERLAEKARVSPERVRLWETGEKRPTFRQARTLARTLHVPFGYLFLDDPPRETLPIPDLRTIGDHAVGKASPELRDLLRDVRRKQDWFRDHLRERNAAPLPFVGRFSSESSASAIAADIAAELELSLDHRNRAKSGEDFLRLLTDKAEKAGIWIMRSGIVEANTHRGLDVSEFRGFAICDPIAPIIFINGKDAPAARIFTLAHELAHIWIGQSGISNPALDHPPESFSSASEKRCNAVAAEVLVPRKVLLSRWLADAPPAENVATLSRFFRVSEAVIARRAADSNLIPWSEFMEFFEDQRKKWKRRVQGDGGNAYRNIPIRNGRRFTEAVVRNALERRLLLRDAGRLLNVSPGNIPRLASEMGIR
jgi:Zn-dependent peptidase ImmA (M78 family)/transcriptional regulator with XRE-family HTH domain